MMDISDYQIFLNNLNHHISNFKLVKADLQRLTSGKVNRMYYILDFSDIYTFINPFGTKAYNSVCIDIAIRHLGFQFLLMSGALYELNNYLQYLWKDIKSVDKRGIKQYINDYHISKTIGNHYKLLADFNKSNELSKQLNQRDIRTIGSMTQLNYLFSSSKLAYGSTAAPLDRLHLRDDIYSKAFDLLQQERGNRPNGTPYPEINNIVDAENFALTYSLNDSLNKSDKIYFQLMTRSSKVRQILNKIIWENDPLFDNNDIDVKALSLCRSPQYAVYFTKLLTYIKTFYGEQQYLYDALRILSNTILPKCEEFQNNVHGFLDLKNSIQNSSEEQDAARVKAVLDGAVKCTLEDFYIVVYYPLIKKLDDLFVKDLAQSRSLAYFAEIMKISDEFVNLDLDESYDYDKSITKDTLKVTQKYEEDYEFVMGEIKRVFNNIPSEIKRSSRIAESLDNIYVEINDITNNSVTKSIKYNMKRNLQIAHSEVIPNEFFTINIDTSLVYDEVLNLFIDFINSFYNKYNVKDIKPSRLKYFDDSVIIQTQKKAIINSLSWPYDISGYVKPNMLTENPFLIRINTALIDLYYTIDPPQLGFITFICFDDLFADLIVKTSLYKVNKEIMKNRLKELLNVYGFYNYNMFDNNKEKINGKY